MWNKSVGGTNDEIKKLEDELEELRKVTGNVNDDRIKELETKLEKLREEAEEPEKSETVSDTNNNDNNNDNNDNNNDNNDNNNDNNDNNNDNNDKNNDNNSNNNQNDIENENNSSEEKKNEDTSNTEVASNTNSQSNDLFPPEVDPPEVKEPTTTLGDDNTSEPSADNDMTSENLRHKIEVLQQEIYNSNIDWAEISKNVNATNEEKTAAKKKYEEVRVKNTQIITELDSKLKLLREKQTIDTNESKETKTIDSGNEEVISDQLVSDNSEIQKPDTETQEAPENVNQNSTTPSRSEDTQEEQAESDSKDNKDNNLTEIIEKAVDAIAYKIADKINTRSSKSEEIQDGYNSLKNVDEKIFVSKGGTKRKKFRLTKKSRLQSKSK